MRHQVWLSALGIILVAAVGQPASADDGDTVARLEKRLGDLAKQNELLRMKCGWLERLRNHQVWRHSHTSVVRLFGSGGGSVSSGITEEEHRQRLSEITLPASPSKDDVREFVARVLAASESRDGSSVYDPEIDLLKRVGSANVDVLVEPLVYVYGAGPQMHLIEAMKGLAQESHKLLILQSLSQAPPLVEVVVARGWTKDAAPILLRGLAERSPYLDLDWTKAAAGVAGPENYPDLKFQLAHGLNPWPIWLAIRGLPGMEPLDTFIEEEWHRATWKRDSWEWKSFAVVAAHYDHLDALGALARNSKGNWDWWQAFQSLTRYQGSPDDAMTWVEENKDRLTFDRNKRTYVRSSGERK